jgi:Predicted esterase
MAFLSINFYSQEVLRTDAEFYVILPNNVKPPYKTVYLLHGLENDHTTWMRLTSIERYANDRGLAIVMPNVERSFYTDMHHGRKFYTYVSQELIDYTRMILPLSTKREDTFIAGFSMGGYGAYKIAFRNYEKFGAVASMSGALDMGSGTLVEEMGDEMELIYGDMSKFYGSDEDLFHLTDKLVEEKKLDLRIYQAIGTSDYLYSDNQRFKEMIETKGFDYTYEESEGDHMWDYWDRTIPRVLDFFLEK